MTRILRIALPVALMVGLLGAYAVGQKSNANPASSVAVDTSQTAPTFATNEVLQRNYVFHGVAPSTAPATWTAVDSPHTVQCPGTAGVCTIAVEMYVQQGSAFSTNNDGALALSVDGSLVCNTDATLGCHYVLELPSDGRFVMLTDLNSISGQPFGAHTVQTFVWTDNGASGSGNYNITYHVYKP